MIIEFKSEHSKEYNVFCSLQSVSPTDITQEEAEQLKLNTIVDNARDIDFRKNLISLLQNYLREEQLKNWIDIDINIHYENNERNYYRCIQNPEKLPYKKTGL